MGATATGALPVTVAFFAAAVAMLVFRVVPLREAYAAMDGPILVMLAALIPVSDSLRTHGGERRARGLARRRSGPGCRPTGRSR